MKDRTRLSAAAQSYATAHDAHYGSKELRTALQLYEEVMAAHPDTQEAGYSRSQIRNIARAVVPSHELFSSEVALALSHLESTASAQVTARQATSGKAGS